MRIKLIALLFLSSCSFSHDRIVFSSGRDGNSNIYSMDTDGSNVMAITTDSTEEWGPSVMNTGEISFLRQTENSIVRVAINPLSMEERYLAHPQNCMLDDKNIRYNAFNDDQLYACDDNIFIADSIGAIKINLTVELSGKAFKPTWYSNGEKVAFTYYDGQQSDIYSILIDGSNLTNITNSSYNEEAPAVSPDGRKLLFSSNKDGEKNQDIYIMDLDTKELVNITNTPDWELIARWSLDGSLIYYGSNKDGNWELYSYDIQEKRTNRLTNSPSFDGDPIPIN